MLEAFPGFKVTDPEAGRDVLARCFGVNHFDCRGKTHPFVMKANWIETRDLRMTSGFCNVSTETKYTAAPFIRQFYFARPNSAVEIRVDGRTEALCASNPIITIPADTPYECRTSDEHSVVTLKIELSALKNVATALLGNDVSVGKLVAERWKGDRFNHVMRTSVMQFITDLSVPEISKSFASGVFGQALLARFLISGSGNIRTILDENIRAPSLPQLHLIEDYIAANWQNEIDIQDISREFGISVRSIFRHFRSLRGTTPSKFLRKLRLDKARMLLQAAEDNSTVTSIALYCGFQSMGHFAQDYMAAYGELPSETLQRSRSRNSIR